MRRSPLIFITSALITIPALGGAPLPSAFSDIRLSSADWRVNGGARPLFALKSVERFFERPFDVATEGERWAGLTAKGPAGFMAAAEAIFAAPLSVQTDTVAAPPVTGLPSAWNDALSDLAQDFATATRALKTATEAVPEADRRRFLDAIDWPDQDGRASGEIAAKALRARFEGMKPFPVATVLRSGRGAMAALMRLERRLPTLPPFPPGAAPIQVPSAAGLIVIGGPGDDLYPAALISSAAIIIDLGGRNHYAAPVGRALAGQTRALIDLGSDVTISRDDGVTGTASALFGIGLVRLAKPGVTARIEGGSYALGFAAGGLAIFSAEGPTWARTGRYSQGFGTFGAGGFFVAGGHGAQLSAGSYSQGVGFVQGVGGFSHAGEAAVLEAGMTDPDPREPLASLSMSQGVGYGPRAYAAGGVGIMNVEGASVSVTASYFAQGCGYWHALGVMRYRGDGGVLQARRYNRGSGIHSAFGHFDFQGDRNRVINWGVGPAYGWDRGIGSARLSGNDNEIQVEWGAQTASVGSLSFSVIEGDRNRLRLNGFADGGFQRDEISWSMHRITGRGNRLSRDFAPASSAPARAILANPYGAARLEGVTIDPSLSLSTPSWPTLDRRDAIERERLDLTKRLEETRTHDTETAVAVMADVAGAFSVDRRTPRTALEKLVTLDDRGRQALPAALDTGSIENTIQIRAAMAAAGAPAFRAARERWNEWPEDKRAALTVFHYLDEPADGIPALLTMARDNSAGMMRLAALRALGLLFNRDNGNEPGLRRIIESLNTSPTEASAYLRQAPAAEALAIFRWCAQPRRGVLTEAVRRLPEDPTGAVGPKLAEWMVARITGRRSNRRRVDELVNLFKKEHPAVQAALADALASDDPRLRRIAVAALGKMEDPAVPGLIAPLLNDASAMTREMAAISLARSGDAGTLAMEKAFNDLPSARRNIIAGLGRATSPRALDLISQALIDRDPAVRIIAATILLHPAGVLENRGATLAEMAGKALEGETDADVRWALERVIDRHGPKRP